MRKRLIILWPLNRYKLLFLYLHGISRPSHSLHFSLPTSRRDSCLQASGDSIGCPCIKQDCFFNSRSSTQEGRERKRRGKTDRDTFMYSVYLVSIIYIVSFDMVTPCVLTSSLGSFSQPDDVDVFNSCVLLSVILDWSLALLFENR